MGRNCQKDVSKMMGQIAASHPIMIMADIKGQFEFIWKQWVNQGDFASLPLGEQDPIIGPGTGEQSMTLPSEPDAILVQFDHGLSHSKCGEYFFMPSITALRGISEQKY